MQTLYDLKYSFRLLLKTPGFTAITLVVLVCGLSLFLAAYSIGIQFNKPVEFPHGDRYVALKSIDERTGFSAGLGIHDLYTYQLLSASSENYETLGAFHESILILSDGDYAQRYSAATITPALLTATTVNPVLGRTFSDDSVTEEPTNSVLVSYRLWQNYYNGDENIVGRVSRIGGQVFNIIGVMPADFSFPHNQDLWFPLADSEASQPGEGAPLAIVGILESQSSLQEAGTEIQSLRTRLVSEYSDIYFARDESVAPFAMLTQVSTSRLTDLDFIVMAVTLIVVALTVINLSSLLFIRSNSRSQELALRSAVGGSGLHLAKQVLAESFIICSVGLVLSFGLSAILMAILRVQYESFGSADMAAGIGLNGQVVIAGGIAMLSIWLVSGLHIALKAYKSQPGEALSTSGKGLSKGNEGRAFRVTVFLEVIVSCFLLILCGYMVAFVNDFRKFDFGVSIDNIVVANVNLNSSNLETLDQRLNYIQALEQEISKIGEIDEVAFTTQLPGLPGQSGTYAIEDRDLEVDDQLPPQASIWVSENYFDIAEVNILAGRGFTSQDSAESENVAIISEVLAQQVWPDGSAVGKRIQSIVDQEEQWLRVVGVISPILQYPFRFGTPIESLYRPLSQQAGNDFFIFAQHQASITAADLVQPIIEAATAADREIPLENVRSLEAEMSLYMGDVPVTGLIFQLFALATLIVASIGIYGVIARSISIRTYEIGIRRALGSSEFRIIGRFIRQGFNFLLAGTLVGILPAVLIIYTITTGLNYGGEINMSAVYTLVVVVLGIIIGIASYFPARKAVRMEPGDALRYE